MAVIFGLFCSLQGRVKRKKGQKLNYFPTLKGVIENSEVNLTKNH